MGMNLDRITTEELDSLALAGSPSYVNQALRTLRRLLGKAAEWKVTAGHAGAWGGGVGEAVFGGVDDDFVEEGAPVGGGDADVGVAGALVRRNTADAGVELRAGGGEGGDLRGEERDHEAAGSERVEGVDFAFEIFLGVAGGGAAIVEASCEEEEGGGGVEVEWFGLVGEEGSEFFDLLLHAEGEEGLGGFAVTGARAGFGGADGEVERLILGVGIAEPGERDGEALGEVGDGGGSVGVGKAGAGVGGDRKSV